MEHKASISHVPDLAGRLVGGVGLGDKGGSFALMTPLSPRPFPQRLLDTHLSHLRLTEVHALRKLVAFLRRSPTSSCRFAFNHS